MLIICIILQNHKSSIKKLRPSAFQVTRQQLKQLHKQTKLQSKHNQKMKI